MPIRLRYRIEVAVSSTPAEERDLGHIVSEVVTDSIGEGGTFKTRLAAGANNVQIALDNVSSAAFLMVRTTTVDLTLPLGAVTLRRNSPTGEAIIVAPFSGQKEAHVVLVTSGLTALYASNTGSSDVELTVIFAGD